MPKPKVNSRHSNQIGHWGIALKFQHVFHPQVRWQLWHACFVVSLAKKVKMLNKCENGPPISNTSATNGEVTILTLTWSSHIQWNGRIMNAKLFHEELICSRGQHAIFIPPDGSMKGHIIAKQKIKFIIDANIIVSLIFGLLFSNSDEDVEE